MDRETMMAIEGICNDIDTLLGIYYTAEEKDPLLKAFLVDVCRARSRLMSALMDRQDEHDSQMLEEEI